MSAELEPMAPPATPNFEQLCGDLKKQNDNLTRQLENFKNAIDNMNCQLEASNQMFNESIKAQHSLRVSVVQLQKQLQAKPKV